MKFLSEKSNKSLSSKQLKREAELLYQSADDIYWHEMEKPRSERDTELMAECLRTIKETSEILNNKKTVHEKKPMTFLKWAAIACSIVIALMVVSTGVAYAAGFNIWSFLFSDTKNNITIQGAINDNGEDKSSPVDFAAVENIDGEECTSFDEAITKLGINPTNLDLTNMGMMIHNIYIIKNDAMMELSVDYSDDVNYAYYTVQVFNSDANTAFITDVIGSYDTTETVNINGIEIHTATGDEENVLCWTDGVYVYQVNTDLDISSVISCIHK